jgi:phage terminase small subunit
MNEQSKLTARQRRFVDEYLLDLNATQAAIRAGYSANGADVAGVRLLGNVRVQAAIAEGQQARKERTDITADAVLQELALIAFSDVGEVLEQRGGSLSMRDLDTMPVRVRRGIESVREQPTQHGTTWSVKMHSKIAALSKLADHLGLSAPQKHEHTGKGGKPIETVSASLTLSDAAADAIMRKALLGQRDGEG